MMIVTIIIHNGDAEFKIDSNGPYWAADLTEQEMRQPLGASFVIESGLRQIEKHLKESGLKEPK